MRRWDACAGPYVDSVCAQAWEVKRRVEVLAGYLSKHILAANAGHQGDGGLLIREHLGVGDLFCGDGQQQVAIWSLGHQAAVIVFNANFNRASCARQHGTVVSSVAKVVALGFSLRWRAIVGVKAKS